MEVLQIINLAVGVVVIVGWWKMFVKAGQPGWAAIIPFYNLYILLLMAQKPVWWMILFFVPIVNFVVAILVYIEIAKLFGKGTGFAIGMVFLGFIFIPILGFGDAKYMGEAVNASIPPVQNVPPQQEQPPQQ